MLNHRGDNHLRSGLPPAPFIGRLPAPLSRERIGPHGSPGLHPGQPPYVPPRLSGSSPIGEPSPTLSHTTQLLFSTSPVLSHPTQLLLSPPTTLVPPTQLLLTASSPSSLPIEAAIISVRGNQFRLSVAFDQISACTGAYLLAEQYHACLSSSQPDLIPLAALCSHLDTLRVFFAPSRAEAAALEAASDFKWSDEVLNRDRDLLVNLGSLEAVVTHYRSLHQAKGINESRVREWLGDDPNLEKMLEIATIGGQVDVDDDFVPFRRSAPLRSLQQRLLPVYRKHAFKMHQSGKGLLFRLSDIPPAILGQMHTANECHWVTKPGVPAGRFIIDCSNVGPMEVPLNGGTAKEKGIARYQQVHLPSIITVLRKWDAYRRLHALEWADMWIFKTDIASCFNQISWSFPAVLNLATMVDDSVVFVMLTGGFGHCVTPMIWSLFGDAITRRVRREVECPIDTYVDDTFGAGSFLHVSIAQPVVWSCTKGPIGPTAIEHDKDVFAQVAEILGYHIDMLTATIRPRDKALDKLFFVVFNFNFLVAQPLVVWQCLSSLVNMYSHVLRGLRPFVSPILRMVKICGSRPHSKAIATASTIFAIEIWRAAMIIVARNRTALSVPLDYFILGEASPSVVRIVSDASPWRLAAALYHARSGALLAWSTILLPFPKDAEGRFQMNREFLGHLFSLLLLLKYHGRAQQSTPLLYEWVNDNRGALAWSATHKCSCRSGSKPTAPAHEYLAHAFDIFGGS